MADAYIALFLGTHTAPRAKEWDAMSDKERQEKAKEGIEAWKAWAMKHQASIVEMGGPCGKTKRISAAGIEDVRNAVGGFTIVRAASHAEAAKMFENHPHFTFFPGDSVEVMPIMPAPAG
ncbi:MAG: hypothetical protein KGM42_09380 [Hyphomicrobiales bacterium]|nr:hypothetical protein [Hyphomicrobiales bacterium]